MAFCKKCGKEINDSSEFCPFCGEKRIVDSTEINIPVINNAESKHKEKLIKPIVGVVVALALVILGIKFIPSFFNTENQSDESKVTTTDNYSEIISDITETNTLIEQAIEDIGLIDKNSSLESLNKFKQRTLISEELQKNIAKISQHARSLNIDDKKLSTQVNAYFDIADRFASLSYETHDFILRFIESEDLITSKPDYQEYGNDVQSYYDDFNEWLTRAKDSYKNFVYPSHLENKWKEYEDIINLNESIISKFASGLNYNDSLRIQSFKNLLERNDLVEDKWFTDALSQSKYALEFVMGINSYRLQVLEEIQNYVELSNEKKDSFEFLDINNKMSFFAGYIRYEETIYPTLYNTYSSFANVNLGTIAGKRDIVIETEIPGFTQKYTKSFSITGLTNISIKPPLLTEGLNLSSAKPAQLIITLYEKDGSTVIKTENYDISLKSQNDFSLVDDDFGIITRDNFLCFVSPESAEITQLKRTAVDKISEITAGNVEQIVGYQGNRYGNNYVGTYLQAAAIMQAMYDMGVRYNADTFSISGSKQQHVLLPSEVINNRSGVCIETSLVMASALQSAGMHTFLIFPPGHAQVAVEVWNKKGEEGIGEYFLIETTALSKSNCDVNLFRNCANEILNGNPEYTKNSCIRYMSQSEWSEQLNNLDYIIDCNDSRILGFIPYEN